MYFQFIRRASTVPRDAQCAFCSRPIVVTLENVDPTIPENEINFFCELCYQERKDEIDALAPNITIGALLAQDGSIITSKNLNEIENTDLLRSASNVSNFHTREVSGLISSSETGDSWLNRIFKTDTKLKLFTTILTVIYFLILLLVKFLIIRPGLTETSLTTRIIFFPIVSFLFICLIFWFYIDYRLLISTGISPVSDSDIGNITPKRLNIIRFIRFLFAILLVFPCLFSMTFNYYSNSTNTEPIFLLKYGYACFAILAILTFLIFVLEVFYWIWRLVEIIATKACTCCICPISYSGSHRNYLSFWRMGIILALITALALSAFSITNAKKDPEIVDIHIPLSKFPLALDNYTVALITDVHVGSSFGKSRMESIVSAIIDLDPNLVVLLGDMSDGEVGALGKMLTPLSELASVDDGAYLVLGNHDYYYCPFQDWVDFFTDLNITVLQNEFVTIPSNASIDDDVFDLAGIPYYDPDLDTALVKDRNSSHSLVLLSHIPQNDIDSYSSLELVLSGHTHAGQAPPLKWGLPVVFDCPYGLCRSNENTLSYTSQGTNYWGPPVRLGTHNEITLIHLRNKAQFLAEGRKLDV